MCKDRLAKGTLVVVANPRSVDFRRYGTVVDDKSPFNRKIRFASGDESNKSNFSLEPANKLDHNPFDIDLEPGDRVLVTSDCSSWHREGEVSGTALGKVEVRLVDNGTYCTYTRSSLAKLKEPDEACLKQDTIQELIQEFSVDSKQPQDTPVVVLYKDFQWEMFESEQRALNEIDQFEDEKRVAYIIDAANPRKAVRTGLYAEQTTFSNDDWFKN